MTKPTIEELDAAQFGRVVHQRPDDVEIAPSNQLSDESIVAKFEYRVEGFNVSAMSSLTIASKLTELGHDGWEVIAVGWPNRAFVLLKRQ